MILLLATLMLLVACTSPEPATQPARATLTPTAATGFTIPRQAVAYRNYLIQTARYYWGLDVDLGVFFAQVHQESAWNDLAVSRSGASGLAQFMPGTASDIQRSPELSVLCPESAGCPFEPKWALRAMVVMDRDLWNGASWSIAPRDRWGFLLSGYNGGRGWWVKERSDCSLAGNGCDPRRWFGHVEHHCLRAAAACTENRQYPLRILDRWAPGYSSWLAR